jgi:hypothetical protein
MRVKSAAASKEVKLDKRSRNRAARFGTHDWSFFMLPGRPGGPSSYCQTISSIRPGTAPASFDDSNNAVLLILRDFQTIGIGSFAPILGAVHLAQLLSNLRRLNDSVEMYLFRKLKESNAFLRIIFLANEMIASF